ncbi:MAG: porin [Pseudomonadota bacterium]|nr:porin [Pseudomonadota bacterium]
MTLIKSLLLGSAAGIVAVASAQAADLPTRKGPVAAEYVRVCSITVAGAPVVGFVLPGSDTCFKLSGYVTGQVEGGNLKVGHNVAYAPNTSVQNNVGTFGRDSFGMTTRANLTFDAVSNTAYGPLVAHAEYQLNHSGGFDSLSSVGSDGGLNRAYVTWAGLTAGKIDSFFSFTGGGLAWANFFSPDRKGYAQPDVLAYTASFGGGFAATISLEDPYAPTVAGVAVDPGTYQGYLGSAVEGGMRFPDIVGALSVHQAWGAAQISGVAHNIRATSLQGDGATLDRWGFAVDAGVSFNIPSIAGATVGLTGAWSRNAVWYSGLPDGMWGENGAVNGNGQAMAIGDAFANGDGTWATPTAWSISGWAQFQVNPQVSLGVEGSYGQINWTGQLPVSMLSDSRSFIVGAVAHYDPVKNLDFEFELLYQGTTTTMPTGYIAGNGVTTTANWQGQANGFAGRFEVTRSF